MARLQFTDGASYLAPVRANLILGAARERWGENGFNWTPGAPFGEEGERDRGRTLGGEHVDASPFGAELGKGESRPPKPAPNAQPFLGRLPRH